MADLIPVDRDRCQVDIREGSFMTLGPRQWVRCDNQPVFVVTEKTGDPPGAMSMCQPCYEVFLKKNMQDKKLVDVDVQFITRKAK